MQLEIFRGNQFCDRLGSSLLHFWIAILKIKSRELDVLQVHVFKSWFRENLVDIKWVNGNNTKGDQSPAFFCKNWVRLRLVV